jgi:hypothetical protein
MSLPNFNLGWFILVCGIIGLTRLLFVRILPLRLFSVTTAATLGFVLFLVFPIVGYSDLLAISLESYCGFVWLAYVCFLMGAAMARRLLGENKKFDNERSLDGKLTGFALGFCVVWVLVLLFEFFWKGGFAHMRDVFFGGWAHLEVLAQIGDLTSNNQGLGLLEIGRIFLGNIFPCFWVHLYLKMPKRAVIIWGVYTLTYLDEYIARSALLGLMLVPIFAYIMLNHVSARRVVLLSATVFVAGLAFLSWDSAVRLGVNYKVSTEQIVSDTIRDAGNSAIPATIILSKKIRGNSNDYFLAIATFLIPRSAWDDKPNEQYNYEMTYQLTGLLVGHGTSVITSTMLGEAWYYFGWTGTIWLMLMFGFSAYSFESILTKSMNSIGLFFNIFYITIIYIRSTFLAYYQAGIMALLAAGAVMVIVKISSLKQKHIAPDSAFMESRPTN